MSHIPRTVAERLLKRGGAERVSADAKDALAAILEEHAAKVAHEAVKAAQREGRNTVRASDIAVAKQTLPGSLND